MSEEVTHSPARVPRGEELSDIWRLAKGLALSGMFPDARREEQALAKILLGRDLGLSPTAAMTGIHIVEGKPQLAAVTLGAFVRQLPGYDYNIVDLTDERCEIEFLRDGERLGVSVFTMEDAERAGLVKPKSGWEKYPRNMLFARAISNGVKWYAPDATHGIPVYHEGEIEPRQLRDGAVEGSASEATAPDIYDVLDEIEDETVRETILAIYLEARKVRPGQLTPAAVEMSIKDQPPEAVIAYLEEQAAANTAAREQVAETEVADAEVVVGDES